MQTVVARFHHLSRDLAALENDLRAQGAQDAQITGFVVAMTFDADTHAKATKAARRALDGIGATRLKITKRRGGKYARARGGEQDASPGDDSQPSQ